MTRSVIVAIRVLPTAFAEVARCVYEVLANKSRIPPQ